MASSSNSQTEPSQKRAKADSDGDIDSDIDSDTPFTVSGVCDDEVTFVFEDDKKLYISRNFLKLISPVFTAMLSTNFKEAGDQTVTITDVRCKDFLEFLLVLHPAVQKPVTVVNVYQVHSIAAKYMATKVVDTCIETLKTVLSSEFIAGKNYGYRMSICVMGPLFRVLHLAILHGYDRLRKEAVSYIAKLNSQAYLPPKGWLDLYKEEKGYTEDNAEELWYDFMELPLNAKCELMYARLIESNR